MGFHQKLWTASEDAIIREHLEANGGRFDSHTFRGLPGRSDSAVEARVVRIRGTAPSRAAQTVPAPAPEIPVHWDDPDERTEPGVRPADDTNGLLAKLAALTKRGAVTLESLCDALDQSPKRVRSLIEEAQARGFRVELDGSFVGRRPIEGPAIESRDVHVAASGDRRVIAIVGDIHFGSKHHLSHYFQDFCRYAYERGARTFLHVGDLLDGNYKHSVWEQSARGYDEQVAVAIEQLPRWSDAVWYFIQGNHDETLGEANGMDVGRSIELSFQAAGRSDLVYLGPRRAYVRLVAPGDRRGLFVELWHPRDKGNAYAKSYRMQKHIESLAPGAKADLLCVGHWHQQMSFTCRGVHALSAGCWQGSQSSFGRSLSGSPDIGSWVIEYALTSDGTVRNFIPEWRGYFEHETVRDVALG